MQLKQSQRLIVPGKVLEEELEKLKQMKLDHAVKFLCKQLKEINSKLIRSVIELLWQSE